MKVNLGRYPKNSDKERKISIKIDKWDNWNLDHTLALIIHPALVDFKQREIGTPGSFDEIPTDDQRKALWNEYLDKMILAFSLIIEDDYSCSIEDYKTRLVQKKEGLALFAKYFENLWT